MKCVCGAPLQEEWNYCPRCSTKNPKAKYPKPDLGVLRCYLCGAECKPFINENGKEEIPKSCTNCGTKL